MCTQTQICVHSSVVESRELGVREARSRFAELIDDAANGTTSFVTRHGRRAAAVVPAELAEQLLSAAQTSEVSNDHGADLTLRHDDGSVTVVQLKRYVAQGKEPEPRPAAPVSLPSPPAVGKTSLLARILDEAVSEGRQVLVFAPTGSDVDQLLARWGVQDADSKAQAAT